MRIVDGAGGADVSPSKRSKVETAAERPILRFAKLSEHATTPTRGSARAAGYDLYRLVGLHKFLTPVVLKILTPVVLKIIKENFKNCKMLHKI